MSDRPGYRRTAADRESIFRILAAREAILDMDGGEEAWAELGKNLAGKLMPLKDIIISAVPNITDAEFLKVIGITLTEMASSIIASERHEASKDG